MPEVWVEVELRGERGRVRTTALANSGADHTVLTEAIVRKIGPKLTGESVEVVVASGERHYSPLYEVEVTVVGTDKKCCTKAIVLPERSYVLLGVPALEELGAILDMRRGEIRFE